MSEVISELFLAFDYVHAQYSSSIIPTVYGSYGQLLWRLQGEAWVSPEEVILMESRDV
ncbi:MAG: hypothetical protein O4859_14920 [Trichodesmium sp. St18_bin1]|nr:hypothetical protein [Trichodesmium sp. St18_bin1]MDE5124145.1 hypothetical protein [Trichodesmium sp. St19_bin1]